MPTSSTSSLTRRVPAVGNGWITSWYVDGWRHYIKKHVRAQSGFSNQEFNDFVSIVDFHLEEHTWTRSGCKGDPRKLLSQIFWLTATSTPPKKLALKDLACEFQEGKDDGRQDARPHNHHADQDELCANGCASNTGLAGFIGVRHAPEATPAVVVILGKLQPETATKATTSQELLF